MKKIIVGIVAVLLLAGCGSKSKTAVCDAKGNGLEAVNEFTAEGNKVVYQKQVVNMDLENMLALLIEQGVIEDESDLDEYFQSYIDEYEAVEGVKHSYEKKGTNIEQITEIDFKVADMSDLQRLGLIEATSKKVAMIGLKETIKGLESQGFSCTVE